MASTAYGGGYEAESTIWARLRAWSVSIGHRIGPTAKAFFIVCALVASMISVAGALTVPPDVAGIVIGVVAAIATIVSGAPMVAWRRRR